MSSNSVVSDAPLHLLLPLTDKYKRKKQRLKLIEENNLKVNYGRYTKEEDTILKHNWNKFCDEFNVTDDLKNRLVGFFAFSSNYTKQQRREVKQFYREEKFLLRMANGLPHRTLFSIFFRCRTLSKLKRFGQFTSDDKDRIIELKKVWGKKWSKIGESVNCNPEDIYKFIKYSFNKDGLPFNSGRWSARENRKLIKALKKYLQTNDLSDKIFVKNIPWVKIIESAKLNRNGPHSCGHWKSNLRWKVVNFDRMENWRKCDSAKLIYMLFKCNYMNECDIDWDYIKEKFINISSFNNLCKNWQIIKTMVPDFHTKTYKQIINFLYDNYLPNIIKTDDDLKVLEDFYNS